MLVDLEGDDRILCQITSQQLRDRYAIELDDSDLELGALNQKSNIRPTRIFTCDIRIILYRIGYLRPSKLDEVVRNIVEIFQG